MRGAETLSREKARIDRCSRRSQMISQRQSYCDCRQKLCWHGCRQKLFEYDWRAATVAPQRGRACSGVADAAWWMRHRRKELRGPPLAARAGRLAARTPWRNRWLSMTMERSAPRPLRPRAPYNVQGPCHWLVPRAPDRAALASPASARIEGFAWRVCELMPPPPCQRRTEPCARRPASAAGGRGAESAPPALAARSEDARRARSSPPLRGPPFAPLQRRAHAQPRAPGCAQLPQSPLASCGLALSPRPSKKQLRVQPRERTPSGAFEPAPGSRTPSLASARLP